MDSYQCSYGPAWTTPVSYPTQYFVHKENPACRRCGLVHHLRYCVARSSMCFNCGKNGHFARMCKTQKINRRSDVHAIKVVETQRTDRATQTEKRKSERKFQREINAYYLQNFRFPGLKTINSLKILLRINWVMQSRK